MGLLNDILDAATSPAVVAGFLRLFNQEITEPDAALSLPTPPGEESPLADILREHGAAPQEPTPLEDILNGTPEPAQAPDFSHLTDEQVLDALRRMQNSDEPRSPEVQALIDQWVANRSAAIARENADEP